MKSSFARSNAALRLDEIGVGLLDVRRLLDVGQVLRIGRAVLRQRARQRGLLLFEAVLLLLAVELDQDLPGFDTIAEVREDRRTLPSASDEMTTWSTAASVPTTSTERRTASFLTAVTATSFAVFSRLLA